MNNHLKTLEVAANSHQYCVIYKGREVGVPICRNYRRDIEGEGDAELKEDVGAALRTSHDGHEKV